MPLSVGAKLGPYEILAPLGKGGMGEVYRAKDTKLDREVAIKALPTALARDPERIARFEREAKVLAALNHPNIAQIYGLEESNGVRALVMELVPGQTLKGPVPVKTALNYATQIAEALEAAHEKGIIHRDLKPANIMVTPEGTVKVLDFGLAAVTQPAERSDPENSPTLTMGATQAGMVLGTAGYMSPEQAAGQPVDRRADIWAFGVVLYELLMGERLFSGDTVAHTLAAVLTKQPDFARIPAHLRRLLELCLQKEPRQRLQAIGDWKLLIAEEAPVPKPVQHRSYWARSYVAWTAAGVLAVLLAALGYRYATEEPPRLVKVSILAPEKTAFSTSGTPAVSPDGRRVAFVATSNGTDSLWVRDLDSLTARILAGTEGASYPFWSPDSRSLGFFADQKLKRIDVAGGPALTLASAAGNARGGSWSKKDVILFVPSASSSLSRVAAAGGSAAPLLAELDRASGDASYRFPWFLPDGRHFLYSLLSPDPEKNGIYVGDIDSPRTRMRVLAERYNAVYAPPGYLLFLREGTLMAQPFDAAAMKVTGDAAPLAEKVDFSAGSNVARFSASANGVLAYMSGGAGTDNQLTWFDRSGKVTGTLDAPGTVYWPAISPNGNTVAFHRMDQTGVMDLWLHDLVRGASSRFTFGPEGNMYAAWSPDGGHLAYRSVRGGRSHLYQKAANGAAGEEALDQSAPALQRPLSWSRDGRYIIVDRSGDPKTGQDVWVIPLDGGRKPFPFLQTPFDEVQPRLSPDGQWLAYASNESKRFEIYVQKFSGAPAGTGGKWQISASGGSMPVWSKDGKELFFVSADHKMMAVPVKTGATFEAGVPKALFDTRIGNNIVTDYYDVSKDGRFLMAVPAEQSAGLPMTVVLNWPAMLKK